ncbi:uncharacterized protein LOC130729188 [Lotus japonicus]|uniref:uncharacterized protein LOC130729188 n=1 Tax=Lotus japonicus TaxID=34305 RepID=UPI002583692A|nr:uncharacterized protein LOC130729188 [Lotus japonicus]
MTCNWTRGLWLSSHLALRTGDFRDGLEAWVLSMKKVLPADEFDNFIMILWGIWKARNDSVFNKTKPECQQIVRMALMVRQDWLEHQEARGSRIQEAACWNPPPQGYLKINVDAGWSGKEGTGYGLVIRNAEGIFQVAASLYVDHRMDPLMAEALCFRWSLMKAVEWQLDHLVFSSDCQQLIEALKKPYSFPILQAIVEDCLSITDSFTDFVFTFESRSTNRVAHTLAADSFLFSDCTWWGDPPVGILLSLAADFPNS